MSNSRKYATLIPTDEALCKMWIKTAHSDLQPLQTHILFPMKHKYIKYLNLEFVGEKIRPAWIYGSNTSEKSWDMSVNIKDHPVLSFGGKCFLILVWWKVLIVLPSWVCVGCLVSWSIKCFQLVKDLHCKWVSSAPGASCSKDCTDFMLKVGASGNVCMNNFKPCACMFLPSFYSLISATWGWVHLRQLPLHAYIKICKTDANVSSMWDSPQILLSGW